MGSITELKSRGIAVIMTGLRGHPESMLKRIKSIPELIPEQYIFQDFKQYLEWLKDELLDRDK